MNTKRSSRRGLAWPGGHRRCTAITDVVSDEKPQGRSLSSSLEPRRHPTTPCQPPFRPLTSVHRRRRRHDVISVLTRVRLDLDRPGHDDAVSGVVREGRVAVSGLGCRGRRPDVGLRLTLVLEVVQLLVVPTEGIVVASCGPGRPPRGEAATDLTAVTAGTRRSRPLL